MVNASFSCCVAGNDTLKGGADNDTLNGGDGDAGLVFSNSAGGVALWDGMTINGTQATFDQQTNLGNIGATGHVIATADFDGDNKDDILIQDDGGVAQI